MESDPTRTLTQLGFQVLLIKWAKVAVDAWYYLGKECHWYYLGKELDLQTQPIKLRL